MGGLSPYCPCGSILAGLIVYAGIGLFCGASLTAFDKTQLMFNSTELASLANNVLDYERIAVYVWTPTVVVLVFLFVIFAGLATKQSKRQVYDNGDVTCGGKICICICLYTAYLMMFIWVVLGGASLLPSLFTYVVYQYVQTFSGTIPTATCIDLQQYGFVKITTVSTIICGDNLLAFGKGAESAFLMYGLVSISSLLVLLGMVHFLMCMSANWSHVKDGLKRRDYEVRRQEDEEELNEMGARTGLPKGPRAQVYDTNMSQAAYNPHLAPIGGFGEPPRGGFREPPRHVSQPTLSTERLVNDYY